MILSVARHAADPAVALVDDVDTLSEAGAVTMEPDEDVEEAEERSEGILQGAAMDPRPQKASSAGPAGLARAENIAVACGAVGVPL